MLKELLLSLSEKIKISTSFNRTLLAVVCALVFGAVFLVAIHLFSLNRLIDDLELKTYDLRAYFQKGSFSSKPSADILIVEFDDATLNNYEEEYGSWPWSRQVHADMLQFFERAGVRAMAYDIMYISRQKGDQSGDNNFIDAFSKDKNVYIGMNFDNNKSMFEQMGKPFTTEDVSLIQPLSLNLLNQLNPKNPRLMLDDSGFYSNDAMSFNHYRKLMPELMNVQDRIGFVNHGRDKDGVSRSNPIFFRLAFDNPVYSKAIPFKPDFQTGQWFDQQGRVVSAKGILLDKNGNPVTEKSYTYYPYLGLKLLLGLKFPQQKNIQMYLTPNGHLVFPGYDIPLSPTGTLLLKWYNTNYIQEELSAGLAQMEAMKANTSPRDIQAQQQIEQAIKIYRANLDHDFQPEPYQEISAWRIIKAMNDEKMGKMTRNDLTLKEFLRNKILFIGTTAVSTFDIKTSPINKLLPGVVLQATLFDNLYQNAGYMHQADPLVNLFLTGLLCILSAYLIIKNRSALVGFGYTLILTALYIAVAVYVFYRFSIWLNIANPIISLIMTTTLTFMVKYVSRNKDYEATYHLATTDSMTGLKNHRYFQEQMLASIEKANRTQQSFSLLLMDIDHFKKFNDTYGHLCGDEVLRQVAKKLRNTVRSVDLVARYGGEEMAIILDKTSTTEAMIVAEKVRKTMADEPFRLMEGLERQVTISIGVSTYPYHGKSPAELIEFADQGLYRAKKSGRNQVGTLYDNPGANTAANAS